MATSIALLNWYAVHSRPLPWRQNPEPYRIWLVEIMGQQTRIAQLLPYYERFTERFPDVFALAAASEDQVLKAWEGLGYYSRARNLHKAAQIIAHERGGAFPENALDWQKLPGVGPYTAGAIAAIAFGQPSPAVDGNVLRVYARLAGDDTDIRRPEAKAAATAFVQAHMPSRPDDIRQYTQALMELGALVCVPGKAPHCEICPLQADCTAFRQGTQSRLPYKSPRAAHKHVDMTVLIIRNPRGETLMRQRTQRLLQGLWVYYLLEEILSETEVCWFVENLGYRILALEPAGTATHTFTHLKWHMRAFVLQIEEASHTPEGYVFVGPNAPIALPSAMGYFDPNRKG